MYISVNKPVVSKEAKKNVQEALDSGWLSSSGTFVKKFEGKFAKYLGIEHAIAVANGTAALHVGLLSLGIGDKDEVIIPAFTMGSCWLSVLYVGAKPVFVDCDDTFNIDPRLIEEKITTKTKAIMPVHIYGHPCDMDKILSISDKHNLLVIEDAAEAHGARYKGRLCGSFGDLSCFSFYANKLLSTGEGGMIVTRFAKVAKRARRFRDLSHSEKKRFVHDGIGYNYRITNLQAAIGCAELEHINDYVKKKRSIAQLYKTELSDVEGLTLPVERKYAKSVYWMYAILVNKYKFGLSRNQLRMALHLEGVETRDFFYPPQKQPVLHNIIPKNDCFPTATKISENGLYLPSGLAITTKQITYVCKKIKTARKMKIH